MALFATPEQVAAAEREASFATPNVFGLFSGLGTSVGDVGARALGADTRSQMQRDASQIGTIVKGTDFSSRDSVMATTNALNDAGFTDQAFKILSALPSVVKPQKQVVDEWFQNETVGDTTKRFLFQRDNFGFINKVGEVSDKATLDTFKGFSQAWERDIKFDQDSRGTFLGRLGNRPEFKSLVGDTDEEDLGQFTGLIQKVANDMKDDHKDKIRQALDTGRITSSQAQAFSPSSDDWYLDKAYERFVSAGGVEANIDRGMDLTGADVALAPDTNTTDPQALSARIAQGEAKAQAISDVAARTGTLVKGDPRTGQFTVGAMEPGQAAAVFSRMDTKNDEQIQSEMNSLGFQFSPEMLESHAKVWQIMRENPQVTAKFINLSDSPREFKDEAGDLLDQLEDANNFPAFATAARILKYVGRINTGQTAKKASTAKELQSVQETAGGA